MPIYSNYTNPNSELYYANDVEEAPPPPSDGNDTNQNTSTTQYGNAVQIQLSPEAQAIVQSSPLIGVTNRPISISINTTALVPGETVVITGHIPERDYMDGVNHYAEAEEIIRQRMEEDEIAEANWASDINSLTQNVINKTIDFINPILSKLGVDKINVSQDRFRHIVLEHSGYFVPGKSVFAKDLLNMSSFQENVLLPVLAHPFKIEIQGNRLSIEGDLPYNAGTEQNGFATRTVRVVMEPGSNNGEWNVVTSYPIGQH